MNLENQKWMKINLYKITKFLLPTLPVGHSDIESVHDNLTFPLKTMRAALRMRKFILEGYKPRGYPITEDNYLEVSKSRGPQSLNYKTLEIL